MEVIDQPALMQEWSELRRADGLRVAVVPTMGALHEGHLRLIEAAHAAADVVVVTIFVNPLQFDRRDDFERYPRPGDDDLDACRDAGVDAVYAPSAAEMYPAGFQTHVEPGDLAAPMEGAGRHGHFRGVTTVVTKLFNATRPHLATFGQKDYQQLAIVRRMVADLDMGIDIVAVPTVREPDGLALSSRNRRLSPAARAAAVCVPRALDAVLDAYLQGQRAAAALEATGTAVVATEPAARLEYLSVRDASTLEALSIVDRPAVVLTAVWFDDLRLIDNRLLP
jgi:pantoate--beta-alanine ligase